MGGFGFNWVDAFEWANGFVFTLLPLKLRKKLSYWFITSGGLILWTIIFLLFSVLYKRNKESKVCFKGNQDFQFTSSQKKKKKTFNLD